MLKGLEAIEITYKGAINPTGESRWDSEYYKKEYISEYNLLLQLDHRFLSEYSRYIRKGIFDISPDYYQDNGVPFVRTSEIKEPTISFNTTVYLPEEINKTFSKTILKPNDLVFTKIGSYIGDVAILPPTYSTYNFSQNVAGVSLKDANTGYTLLAFFLTHIGQNQIKRSVMLSGQGKLELNDIRHFIIPTIGEKLSEKIKELITASINLQIEQRNIIQAATVELLKAINLYNWYPTKDNMATISCAQMKEAKRFDAEYFHPMYSQILQKIHSNPYGVRKVKDVFRPNKSKIKFEKQQYNYIEIGDINTENGSYIYSKLNIEDLPANAKIAANINDILISTVRPNRGAVTIINNSIPDLVVSSAFTVLAEKSDYKKEVLMLLLRTNIYKQLLLKWNVGSSYPVIKDDDILNLSIPDIPNDIQIPLADKVQKSFRLREESKRLLEIAQASVEISIRQGEAEALKYLEDSTTTHKNV